ncbi:MAG: DUF4124 domain-containing protein [Moraxellaceae bacterium]|nr:DUF4124 domain-containing protein [Moraxellaceae bacterium]
MKKASLLLLPFFAFAANAQVYKCTSVKGATTYQSTPCVDGETASVAKPAASPSASPSTSPSTSPSGSTQGRSAQSVTVVPAGPGERRVQVRYRTNDANAACDGARAMRTAALGAAGAAADADLRNRLDRDVRNACK